MSSGEYVYIWQDPAWPLWQYDLAQLTAPLAAVSLAQGRLIGRLADVGFELKDQACLRALTDDVVKTSAIEGEDLNVDSVRSSIARRLGVEIAAMAPVDRHAEGVVEMILDATGRSDLALTQERVFAWHSALFPMARSGLVSIRVGAYRDDANGPMQVVSGPISRRRRVHFEAPPAKRLNREAQRFFDWVAKRDSDPALLKAGLAHLWFVTLHPFDDGNGRIARAIGDLLLARADGTERRFYSLSSQIQKDRKRYHEILEKTQKGSMDVTPWLLWFLASLQAAMDTAHATLDEVLFKARFWQRYAGASLNERQAKLINRLLDGFEGNLTTSKWAAIAKCSQDTALRDISDLVQRSILKRTNAGGRSTGYTLSDLG